MSCIDVLVGFSRRQAIVAGLGVIRNEEDAQRILRHARTPCAADNIVGHDVAVLVRDELIDLVTKHTSSPQERAKTGAGPARFALDIARPPVEIEIAVGADALDTTAGARDAPDILCIPGFVANPERFHQLREDAVCAFANYASYGGSTILAPQLRCAAFGGAKKVRALPAGAEGIIMVEHTSTAEPATLQLRAAIIERSAKREVSLDAVRQLQDRHERDSQAYSGDLGERIGRWLEHITDDGVLREALEEYRRAAAQELSDPDLYTVLCTHLTVADGGRALAVRSAQARFVSQRIGELVGSGLEVPAAGAALDAYTEVAAKEPQSTDPQHKTTGDRWTFSISLGSYDSATAAGTLPRQLNFLRAVAALPPGSIAMSYRLHAETSADGPDLFTRFDIIVEGEESVISAAQVEGQLRSMLVESWAVAASDQPSLPPGRHVLQINSDMNAQRQISRDDWASVADLLRTNAVPIAVEMHVAPIEATGALPAETHFDEDAWLQRMSAIPYMNVGDDADRRASAYFNLLRDSPREELPSLGFSIVIASTEPIPTLLASTIQHELLGHAVAQIRAVDASEPHRTLTPVRPSELIGIFHPPYGRIQGRGVPARTGHERSYTGRRLPAGATQLGTARVAGPRQDRSVDVALDESARSRHVYVVGRTGTGKTNFLKEICRQDIAAGRGVAVIDPHGELVDYLAQHCGERVEDTVLLDFGDPEMIPALNPLSIDIHDGRSQALHTTDFLRILESRYYSEFTGPVFDDMMRQALETILTPGFPVPRTLDLVEAMYRNREVRRMVAEMLPAGSVLRDRWNVFEAMAEKEKAERVTWMLSKFADLLPPGTPLRLALCTSKYSPLSIEKVIWRQGVLLIKLPESALGSDAASFLGALIVRRIQRAVFDYARATGTTPAERPVFTLCLDEFQKFATAGLESLVAEARKFGCGLVLAHQNLDQLYAFSRFEGGRSRELLDAILGNVGSMVAFRVGPRDVPILAELLNVETDEFQKLPKHKALCRLTVDADDTPCFTLSVADADRQRGTPASAERLRERMIGEEYWLPVTDAEKELDGHFEAFESALGDHRGTVQEHARAQVAHVAEQIQADPEEITEILTDELGFDTEMQLAFLADATTGVLEQLVDADSTVRGELAGRLVPLMLTAGETPSGNEWQDTLADAVEGIRELCARAGLTQPEADRLAAGARALSDVCAAAEWDEDDPLAAGPVMIETLLALAGSGDIPVELTGLVARGITTRSSREEALDGLDTDDRQRVEPALDIVLEALASASRDLPFPTVWGASTTAGAEQPAPEGPPPFTTFARPGTGSRSSSTPLGRHRHPDT